MARRRARGVSRRELLRLGAIGIGIIGLGAACAPTPPAAPAQPPAAPAKPAEAAKPAAPAAPAATAAPAAAAQPNTAPAAPPASSASGKITIVFENDPDTIVPRDAYTNNGYFVLDNVYDHLVARDWSSGSAKLVPELAESWSQVDPKTWRFKLRQGVTFTNGEKFNADAVVAAITDIADPQKPGLAIGEYGYPQSAKKIDDFTAEISTVDPDPIFPERLVHFPIPAPSWLKNANLSVTSTEAVGSGPYILAEYVPKDHLLFKANPNYWGPRKAQIAEIRLIGRREQAVRAAMLQAGEVNLAFHVALVDAKKAARAIIEQTQESVINMINFEHPVFKDIRVRQAIAAATDVPGMIEALYPGGIAEPLLNQAVRKGTVGWNPNIKPLGYNLDEAKRLMKETGAAGTPIEYIIKPGSFPRSGEVGEAVVGKLNEIGFKATVRQMEGNPFAEKKRAVKPGQDTFDLLMTSVSSPVLDSSRIFDSYYVCGARYRIGCDQEWDRRYSESKALTSEARDKAFQGLWEYASDKLWYLPMFGLNWVHAAGPKLQWMPRIDGLVLFSEMSLSS
jgi:peptide/nickel transport system substrate-binding protein